MSQQHTPGPWLRDDTSGMKCDVRAANGRKVALCWGLGNGDNYREEYKAECDANARLIAAAPELLDAAQLALAYINGGSGNTTQNFRDAYEALAAALTKATGSLTC